MNIALLTMDYGENASTIEEHIQGICSSLSGDVWRVDVRKDLSYLSLSVFDILIIHYGVVIGKDYHINEQIRQKISKFSGSKIVFIQDEYRWINETVDSLVFMGIDVLFSVCHEPALSQIYRDQRLNGTIKRQTYTGYINEDHLGLDVLPLKDRKVDIGYRGRQLPYWLGALGQEKAQIVDRLKNDLKGLKLEIDISYLENDRIYGNDWVKFLTSCKAVLGTESGASLCDFSDDLRQSVDSYCEKNPEASFEEVEAACFPGQDGKIVAKMISPRMFEAIALRTLLILYEGEYSGILIPHRHYLPLKKDHSNIEEVIDLLEDPISCQRIVDVAYIEIGQNRKYWMQSIGVQITDALIELRSHRKGVTKRAFPIIMVKWAFWWKEAIQRIEKKLKEYKNRYR